MKTIALKFALKLTVGFWLIAMLIPTLPAFASDASSGCGAGWYLFKDNSLISSSLRNYTNVTFSNTIGMTFGTSNCTKHTIVQNEKQSEFYAEANFQNLMIEMAQGKGEHLHSFAVALGCREKSVGTFSKTMKNNYSEIFKSEDTSSQEMLKEVKAVIESNPILFRACFIDIG